MSAANLARALAFIDEDEGPELNIGGSEPGGSSKHGVSMTVLQEWHQSHGLPPPTMDDMRAVDATLAGQIYTAKFADPIRFNDLPGGVDYRLLDIAVNLGVAGGVMALELALQVWPVDGVMTDALLASSRQIDPHALIEALSAVWISKKHESPNWNPSPITRNGYGRGWTNRNIRATARAIDLIGAGA